MPKRNAQPFLRTSLGTPVTTTPYIIRSAICTHPPPSRPTNTTTPYIIRSAIRTPTNTITPNQHHLTIYNKECIHTHPPPHPHSKYFAHQTKNVALGASIPTILCTFVAHNAPPTSRHRLSEHTRRRKTATNLHKDESTIQHFAHHVTCPCLGHDSRKSDGTNQRHQLSQMS